MLIIGITGGSGAGKTSALRALARLGALIIDCDEVYHGLLATSDAMKAELDVRFPGVIVGGALDRKRLGEIVFGDPAALGDLNVITHKYVSAEVDRRLRDWEQGGGALAAVDAILLIESGLAARCGITVGIMAPAPLRVSRIVARDGVSPEYAKKRIAAQKPDAFFIENCDYMLEGAHNTPEEFEDKCEIFFKEIIGGRENAG